MAQEIRTINFGGVNCYLVRTGDGYILIDTGFSNKRSDIEKELESAGCQPGDLKLIVLTHGDSDHSGNGAYLREKYATKIAVHRGESEVVERGDMILSRKRRPFLTRIILPFFRLSETDRFKPDLYIVVQGRISLTVRQVTHSDVDMSPFLFGAQVLQRSTRQVSRRDGPFVERLSTQA